MLVAVIARRVRRFSWCLLAALLLSAACSTNSAPPTAAPGEAMVGPVPPGIGRADHVLLIFVDGLRPDAITPEGAPHLAALSAAGAHSPGARTIVPTLTLPAHTSHVTGRTPSQHGVTWNTWQPEKGKVPGPTIFDVAHQAGLRTALIAGKLKLRHLVEPREMDCLEADPLDDAEVVDRALDCLQRVVPNLLMVHLPQVDMVGHASGWMSREQRERIRATDAEIDRLLEAIEARRAQERWVIVVTADHGGEGRRHVDSKPIDRGIPWIVWGDGVEARKLPPVSATTTAPAVLTILGLEVPPAMRGRRR